MFFSSSPPPPTRSAFGYSYTNGSCGPPDVPAHPPGAPTGSGADTTFQSVSPPRSQGFGDRSLVVPYLPAPDGFLLSAQDVIRIWPINLRYF